MLAARQRQAIFQEDELKKTVYIRKNKKVLT